MFDPPPGYEDMLGDAETAPSSDRYDTVLVPDIGTFRARRPMPSGIAALAMAGNSALDDQSRSDYIVLFVRNHLAEDELERAYFKMMTGEAPADTLERIARAVATWGTARPTSPSLPSR